MCVNSIDVYIIIQITLEHLHQFCTCGKLLEYWYFGIRSSSEWVTVALKVMLCDDEHVTTLTRR